MYMTFFLLISIFILINFYDFLFIFIIFWALEPIFESVYLGDGFVIKRLLVSQKLLLNEKFQY